MGREAGTRTRLSGHRKTTELRPWSEQAAFFKTTVQHRRIATVYIAIVDASTHVRDEFERD